MSRRHVQIGLFVVALVGLAWAAFVVMGRDGEVSPSRLIGRPVPQVSLDRFDGSGAASLAEPGVVSVVNFWAPWCVPCRREHRDLGALRASWDATQVRLVGVAFQSDLAAIGTFLDEIGEGVPTVIDDNGVAAIEFGVVGVPETFVIDRAGIVRRRFVGPIDPPELQRLIDELLLEGPAA
jgi:cytochrome c biogenesis protein CcmG, thiol:disulfide interchange protein DsbE